MVAARVYLEAGSRWTFAAAVDWPGWCRRGRSEHEALEVLADYAHRYARIAVGSFGDGTDVEVIGRIPGDSTTDFGAPSSVGPWDHEPMADGEAGRLAAQLDSAWDYLDLVVEGAPEALRKGPRGGGRDRDAIAEHVRQAERSYGGKLGCRVGPRMAWHEQRTALHDAVAGGAAGAWPLRYAVRRIAWHVIDHAWEIEDRSA